jgi:O-antigen ligase
MLVIFYTVCPTRYRTRHFFIILPVSQQLGALQRHTTDTLLFISHTTNVLLFIFRCNIFIGFRLIKEMSGSVASGTSSIYQYLRINCIKLHVIHKHEPPPPYMFQRCITIRKETNTKEYMI